MKSKADKITELTDTLAALLEKQQCACQEMVLSLIESARTLQTDTGDLRLQHHAAQLKKLYDKLNLLTEIDRDDFLAKINLEVEEWKHASTDSRIATVLNSFLEAQKTSLNLICESLLDRLVEVSAAERGFILFYIPETTEADVIAARNFQTHNLSLEEYNFSRTILHEVFKRGQPILLENASIDPAFSQVVSVRKFHIKSVLAAPLEHSGRTVGALYLENNKLPCAFSEEDLHLLGIVARVLIFYLYHARLLPAVFDPYQRIFFDASMPSQKIVGCDPKLLSALETISRIADSPATVLIEGESGTGKELVACALHYNSARRDRPFVAINCAAIPDNLLESELFGHEKGAFTGATERYVGHVEQGNGGTIFLDEVGELAYPLQAKLLRFLQSHEFRRLGGKQSIQVDVRVVAATSKDLKAMIADGKFQEALYFRLNVIPVRVPALRERKADIALLIDNFLNKFSATYEKRMIAERGVYEVLKEYSFPGNVRELENLIHRLVALATEGCIRVGDLPQEILQTHVQRVSLEHEPLYRILNTPPTDIEELRRRREEVRRMLAEQELRLAERTVEEAGGNITEAANRLRISRVTLHDLLRKGRNSNR